MNKDTVLRLSAEIQEELVFLQSIQEQANSAQARFSMPRRPTDSS